MMGALPSAVCNADDVYGILGNRVASPYLASLAQIL